MNRHTVSFIIDHPDEFKRQVLSWANENFTTTLFLDNNNYRNYPCTYEGLIAAGVKDSVSLQYGAAFESLKKFYDSKKDWLFGFFSYDLKNETENLTSKNHDGLQFPALFFFQPEWIIEIHKRHAVVHAPQDAPADFRKIISAHPVFARSCADTAESFELHPRISKTVYLETVQQIQQHIAAGDIYEMNFCQEFYAEGADIRPLDVFQKLNELSKAPFSCYLKNDGRYLLCASPERFLKKEGAKLTSMPIKGTIRRGKTFEEDSFLKEKLRHDGKELSENVMIVDLVRNDLSKSCTAGSVKADELFGIKTFEQVHQMVSTVSGTLRDDLHCIDAIKNAFPMGSMTGAPKVRAMQLIEQYEKSKRGLYSGAAGYLTPEGDFDFNVVIRSLLYNAQKKYLSFHAGSAITFDSVPAKEYEECLLKAKALREALKQSASNKQLAAGAGL